MSINGVKSYNTNNIEGTSLTSTLDQIPINTADILDLQQITTGIIYTSGTTTINNNVTIIGTLTTTPMIATQTYVNTQISALVASAPATLDTLNELANALGADPNFATTVTNNIASKASLADANIMTNPANIFYGDGSHLTGLASSNPSVTLSNLGINQVVPLINTQTATAGTYQLNIGANYNNNLKFNNELGALTCNYYYGDGFNLTNIPASISHTSLNLNQLVPLLNMQTSVAGNYALNISPAYDNNMRFNNSTGALTCNYYYGNGSNLTNIIASSSATINTTIMPPSGTYYLQYTTSSTSASGLTTYTDSQIAYDKVNNKLVVPNLNMYGTLTMTSANPIITTTGNYNLVLNTPSGSTGSLIFQTQGQIRMTIATGGASRFFQQIALASTVDIERQINNTYYNLHDKDTTGGGSYKGRMYTATSVCYLELDDVGHIYRIFIGGVNVFEINLTQATFLNLPECSDVPTKGMQLANKTYVDSVIPSLTNYVDKSTAQTISGAKTFSGDIIISDGAGTNNSTIDQFSGQLNIKNNILNNSIVPITALIPAVNLNCLVRTDSSALVTPYGAITGPAITGTNIMNSYNNNFYVMVPTTGNCSVTLLSLTTLTSTAPLAIGVVLISLGVFYDGTYVVSLTGSTYTISRAATNMEPTIAITYSYTPLNRAYSGAVASNTVYLDYNTSINLQCKNSSSVNLNAISIKQNLTTSTVSMYGDVKLEGALRYSIGNNITANTVLGWPLPQLFLISNASAITVSFPTVTLAHTGTVVYFKRYGNAGGTVTFNCVGGASSMVKSNALVASVATTAMPTTQYYTYFICIGTLWMQMI